MKTLLFADSWQQYFAGFGLDSFDDFYAYPRGTKIGKNRKRNVYRLTFGQGTEQRAFYVKRFTNPHLKDILAARRNFGRVTSQARAEWNNTNLLNENGIDTYRPVCVGEQTLLGVERKSFLITEELQSRCLLDFVLEKWRSLERSHQEAVVVSMAELARRVHRLDIALPDMYIWHFFIDEDRLDHDCHLAIIDLHRMRRNVKSPLRKAADVGRLYWSLADDYFDSDLKDLLIRTYIRGAAKHALRVADAIRRRAELMKKRRILEHHYNKPKPGSA